MIQIWTSHWDYFFALIITTSNNLSLIIWCKNDVSIAFLKFKKKSLYKINCLVKWVGLKFKNFKNIEKKCTNINENPQTTWKKKKKKEDSKQYESDHFFFKKKVFNKKSLTQDPSNWPEYLGWIGSLSVKLDFYWVGLWVTINLIRSHSYSYTNVT